MGTTILIKVQKIWKFIGARKKNYYNALFFLGQRLVVTNKMRTYVLSGLHCAYQDITACQAKAKIAVYWPNIQHTMEDIKNYI